MRIQLPARRWLALALVSSAAACGGDGGGNGGGDRSRPTVTATSPSSNAQGVERASTVSATFSEPIAANTVNSTTFTVSASGGAPIAGMVTMSGTTATFTPSATLASGTTYTARLTTGIKDVAGNELASTYSWTFTTVVNPPPVLMAMTPPGGATNVARNTQVTAAFNENINPASANAATFTVTPAGGAAIAGTVVTNNAIVTFTPATALAPSTTYTVRLTTGITDVEGAALAGQVSWTFTTVANIPPTANAGSAQDVNRGAMVQLMGTATDPEGETMTFRWTQVAGPDVTNGAGFLAGATVNFTAPNVVSALRFELRVTDQSGATSQASVVQINVMENALRAIFVSPLGDDANNGTTRATPVKTIAAAIARATALGGGADVYLVNGTYNESVTLASDVSIYGGFQSGTWLRDRDAYPVTIQGGAEDFAVRGDGATGVILDGLRITTPIGANATGRSRYGVFLINTADIIITNNRITAGEGGPGSAGLVGITGIHGQRGLDATGASCTGTPQPGRGGVGGEPGASNGVTPPGFTGATGGDGGTPTVSPTAGRSGEGFSPGAGGPAGSIANPDGTNGGTGSTGSDGPDGSGGGSFGAVSSPAGYVAPAGTAGSRGNPGASGGGGGGGFAATGAGGGGGGGGASGGWGAPATGGSGGGASVAILVMSSVRVVIDNNVLTTVKGGAGGAGGSGGAPGLGGFGGINGLGCGGGGSGGFGGQGGNGGRGGHGGGGGGGPSIGILEDAPSAVTIGSGNTYQLGAAGVGGTSQGNAGANGVSAQTRK